jgi:hypothetical protein
MTTKIAKQIILGLALLGLFGGASARAQIALQDGSTNKIISNSGSSSISTNFTVTAGAGVLVVSLYDRNNVASESAPASLSWGAQTLTQVAGEYNARSTYATVATYYLYNPPPALKPSPPPIPREARLPPWRCRFIPLTASARPTRPWPS